MSFFASWQANCCRQPFAAPSFAATVDPQCDYGGGLTDPASVPMRNRPAATAPGKGNCPISLLR